MSFYPVRWGLDLEQFALKLEHFNSELCWYLLCFSIKFTIVAWGKVLSLYLKAQVIVSSAADSDSHLQSLVLRLGNFHTQMSFLGCIGHLMGSTGLQEAFGLVYAENVVVHILNGKAYSRAVRAHLLMDAALSAILTSGAFDLPWILIHLQADDALLGDESDDSPTLMDTSVAEEVFDMEEIGLLNTDAMANPSTSVDTFIPQTGCAFSEETGTSNMEALPQVGHEDLDAAVCLLERLVVGGISAEEAANHDVISKINKRLEEHKESVSRSRTSSLWFQYLDMVGILKKSIKAERTGRFDLHLQSVALFLQLQGITTMPNLPDCTSSR